MQLNIIKLFIHACNFNSSLSVSGITTYEYVRAHRVAQERKQQLHAERLTAPIANQNADEKARGYKHLSDNSNSSGSQLQWDKLEREHGPGSKQDERRCLSTCCQCPLPISFCNKNSSNIHPMPQQQRSSGLKNDENPTSSEKNNKHSTTNNLKSESDNHCRRLSIKYPMSLEEKQQHFQNENDNTAISYSVDTTNVISSSVPKLPSISIVSANTGKKENDHEKDISGTSKENQSNSDTNGNDELSRKNLELLELNIKSVEDQNHSRSSGKKTYHSRSNGVNRYNHLPWNNYHEDQDAIFVVDA